MIVIKNIYSKNINKLNLKKINFVLSLKKLFLFLNSTILVNFNLHELMFFCIFSRFLLFLDVFALISNRRSSKNETSYKKFRHT